MINNRYNKLKSIKFQLIWYLKDKYTNIDVCRQLQNWNGIPAIEDIINIFPNKAPRKIYFKNMV